jgi:hypothetical protein
MFSFSPTSLNLDFKCVCCDVQLEMLHDFSTRFVEFSPELILSTENVFQRNVEQTQAGKKRTRKKSFTLDAMLYAKCIYISLLLPANVISEHKKYNFNIFMYRR